MKPSQPPPERGDLIQVDWVDIREDINGDPDLAKLSRRTSYGLFWARRDDDGIGVLITTTTVDHDEDIEGQSGYCIYPEVCVRKVKVVRRAHPRRRKKEPPSHEHPQVR